MSLQPGDGYTFKASSSGFSLDIEKPWTAPTGEGLYLNIPFPNVPLPPDPPIPPVDPSAPAFVDPFAAKPRPLQFQCNMASLPVSGTPTPVLQVAMGSVTYNQSFMPFIKVGPFTDYRQAYMNFAAVLSSGVTPVPLADATSPWMLGGGGYALTGTGRWYVTISKWDVVSAAMLGGVLDLETPWVSIVKNGSDEFDKLFVDTGPSLYENQTNIQKMEGYQEVLEGEGGVMLDWGHCHTTYFNPRFIGNNIRILAVIDSIAAPPCEVSIVQLRAGSATENEIQQIIFVGIYKSGTVTFTYGGDTTTTAFNPGTQSAYDLQQCLNTIPALSGNVVVQQAGPGLFQVEFTNTLRFTDVAMLVANSSLTSFTNWYTVYQCHVGSQDIIIPCELNATFLMNKPDLNEAGDPYYANAGSIPPWADISNIETARAAATMAFIPGFSSPIFNSITPREFERPPHQYAEEDGCTPEPTADHPFKVKHVETSGGDSTYSIVYGTINNEVPGNIASTITVLAGAYEVWVKVPYDSAATPNFPAATGYEWNIGTPVPADTDSEGYVRVASVDGASVTQYVTGSLWADRIKVGAATAKYYYARI